MERDMSQRMCRSGCGFYGNNNTDGLCSQCYKDAVKRKQSTPSPAPTPTLAGRSSPVASASTVSNDEDLATASPTVTAVTSPATLESDTAQASSSATTTPSLPEPEVVPSEEDQKKKKNRCHVCKKKVGLTGFPCRCSGLFCSVHRYSNEHNCPFDYKQLGAQEIRKNNPLVVGEKINKI